MAFVASSGLYNKGVRSSRCSRRATVSMVATVPQTGTEGRSDTYENVRLLGDTEEFTNALGNPGAEFVVVKFFAPWCRACKKVGPLLDAIAPQHPTMSFGEINFAENRELCRSLGIKAMPTFHVYSNGERIEDFSCGPKRFPELVEKLESLERGYCKIEEDEA